jgi:hypothetical protein
MPDTTAPTAPVTTPEPATPDDTPSVLNEGQLASLTKTEEICRVALLPGYLGRLTTLDDGEEAGEDHITEAGIRALLDLCAQARGKGAGAATATGDKKRVSKAEAGAGDALVALIRFFQARARQKHFFKNPGVLAEYGIGENIEVSRTVLEGYAQAVYDKTAADKLPKITDAKRAELKAALDAYKKAQTDQTSAISAAGGLRLDRDELVRQATAGRMQLQFAADAEWPFTDPANYPVRREFQLPANRAFIG